MKTLSLEQAQEEGLRVIEGYDTGFSTNEAERTQLKQYLGDLYNKGIPVTDEVFQDLIQDRFDLQEYRDKLNYRDHGADYQSFI